MKYRSENLRSGGRIPKLVLLFLVLGALVAAGLVFGYDRLHGLWLEQCVIRDVAEQVHIVSGKMVKPDVIAENFGLRKGANLAQIDFTAKRAEVLAKIPNLRAVSVTRHLPDRVSIVAEEREPIARLSFVGRKGETGKVVDTEGVVFYCQRGTRLLPVIREANAPGTAVGHRAGARTAAAVRLVEAFRDAEYQEFGLLEADVSRPDYILLTLGGANYARVKFAWADMDDEETPESRAALQRQLRHLREAIRSRLGDDTVIWNATDTTTPGRIYADTKGKL